MRRLMGTLLLVVGLLAAPAAAVAAPEAPTLRVGAMSVTPGGAMRETYVAFRTTGPPLATSVHVEIDLTAVASTFTVTGPATLCRATPEMLTCGPGYLEHELTLPLTIAARPGAAVGDTALLAARAVAGGRTLATATGRLTVAQRVDLTATSRHVAADVAVGDVYPLRLGVRVTGGAPVEGTVLRLHRRAAFEGAPRYRNCRYDEADDPAVTCWFDGVLPPGTEYQITMPLRVTDAQWAPSREQLQARWFTPQDWSDAGGGTAPSGGTGPELRLEPVAAARAAGPQTDGSPYGNTTFADLTVTGRNWSNFSAQGDTATGAPGSTVGIAVSARNHGPALLDGYGVANDFYLGVTVSPPPGTTIVGAPDVCRRYEPMSRKPYPPDAVDDGRTWYCWTEQGLTYPYPPERTRTWAFTLRLDEPGTHRGAIKAKLHTTDGPQPTDPDPSDDVAPIVVTATAATAAPTPSAGASTGGGGGGELPITGGSTGTIALAGLLLVLAGLTGRVLARRR